MRRKAWLKNTALCMALAIIVSGTGSGVYCSSIKVAAEEQNIDKMAANILAFDDAISNEVKFGTTEDWDNTQVISSLKPLDRAVQ